MDNILNTITAYRKEPTGRYTHAVGEHRVGQLFQSVGGHPLERLLAVGWCRTSGAAEGNPHSCRRSPGGTHRSSSLCWSSRSKQSSSGRSVRNSLSPAGPYWLRRVFSRREQENDDAQRTAKRTDGKNSVHGKTPPKGQRVFLIVTQPAGVCAIIFTILFLCASPFFQAGRKRPTRRRNFMKKLNFTRKTWYFFLLASAAACPCSTDFLCWPGRTFRAGTDRVLSGRHRGAVSWRRKRAHRQGQKRNYFRRVRAADAQQAGCHGWAGLSLLGAGLARPAAAEWNTSTASPSSGSFSWCASRSAAAFILAADALCGHERPCLLDEHPLGAAGLCPWLGSSASV